jgi:hypothetical protein
MEPSATLCYRYHIDRAIGHAMLQISHRWNHRPRYATDITEVQPSATPCYKHHNGASIGHAMLQISQMCNHRPHHATNIGSHSTTEGRQHWAWSVLGNAAQSERLFTCCTTYGSKFEYRQAKKYSLVYVFYINGLRFWVRIPLGAWGHPKIP